MTEKPYSELRNVLTRIFEGTEIMSASTVTAYDCGSPDCHHVHLIGRDEDDLPICEIMRSEDEINRLHDLIADRDHKRGH